MDAGTIGNVLEDHLAPAQQGDLEADIRRNFDGDRVLMTSCGRFRGHAGVRDAARRLIRQMGAGGHNHARCEWHDELAFLECTVGNERVSIPDGADSCWIKDGRIRAMTIHYTREVHTRPVTSAPVQRR